MSKLYQPSVVIHDAAPKHRPIIVAFMGELQRLETQMHPDLADPAEMAEPHVAALEAWAERSDGGFLLAMIGDSIVGVALYGVDEEFGYYVQPQFKRSGRISDLYVEDDYRQHGVGRKLILAAEERLREKGVLRIEISTLFENIEARNFYELNGYRQFQVQYAKKL